MKFIVLALFLVLTSCGGHPPVSTLSPQQKLQLLDRRWWGDGFGQSYDYTFSERLSLLTPPVIFYKEAPIVSRGVSDYTKVYLQDANGAILTMSFPLEDAWLKAFKVGDVIVKEK